MGHPDGIFTPLVKLGKTVLGEDELNKVRAQIISKHTDVIKNFVDTHSTPTGKIALNKLGFKWLNEKQINGIVKRADLDENGVVDFEEFLEAAPKTLRTNLVKLAKKNGGELGFLS